MSFCGPVASPPLHWQLASCPDGRPLSVACLDNNCQHLALKEKQNKTHNLLHQPYHYLHKVRIAGCYAPGSSLPKLIINTSMFRIERIPTDLRLTPNRFLLH
eukprot:6487350-Heterocapsa_arctica.AAC.1